MSKPAGCSGAQLGQSARNGEGGIEKEGDDIQIALLCLMTHSHGLSPVSTALAHEARTRCLPSSQHYRLVPNGFAWGQKGLVAQRWFLG